MSCHIQIFVILNQCHGRVESEGVRGVLQMVLHVYGCTDFTPVLHITCPDQAYVKLMDICTETHIILNSH